MRACACVRHYGEGCWVLLTMQLSLQPTCMTLLVLTAVLVLPQLSLFACCRRLRC